MAEHSELVGEIPVVEKMATGERLKHAKKRRAAQLKKFSQYEKQIEKEKRRKNKNNEIVKRSPKLTFANNIMLLEAASRNDVTEVGNLLKKGVNCDVTNEDGLTALHQCCIDDQKELMKLLLSHGANVNAQDSELWTPLHAAATCGHVHLCEVLINNGGDLLAVNADGNMPYDICEDDDTLDFIECAMAQRGITQELIDDTRLSTERKMLDDLIILAKAGTILEYQGRANETLLHVAAANGYNQVAEFLIEQGANVCAEDDDQWQPIHGAACWGHIQILELLVQHGADLEARTKSGESPLDICEDADIRQRLIEMRDELKVHRSSKANHLKRRKSQNTRSSSIRRSSMREKTPLALREAREEAQRLRESTASAEDDDDSDDSGDYRQPDHNVTDATDSDWQNHTDSLQSEITTESVSSKDVKIDFNDVDRTQAENGSIKVSTDKDVDDVDGLKPVINGHDYEQSVTPDPKLNMDQNQHSRRHEREPIPVPAESTGMKNGINLPADDIAESPNQLQPNLPQNQSHSPKMATKNMPSAQLSGTLSDLKKARIQKESVFSNNDGKNNVMLTDNMQNNKEQTLQHNTNYIPGDRPIHKFTASKSEIIGGPESKTGCCTLL